MFCFSGKKKNNERGLGLLEVSLVLVVISVITVGITQMISNNAKVLQSKNDAEKAVKIATAAQLYLNDNYTALVTATALGPIAIPVAKQTSTGSSPTAPAGFQSIQDAGFLPSTFIDQNSSQQSHALIVRLVGIDELEAIVSSYGGEALDDAEIGTISSLLGASGGGVYNTNAVASTTDITGTRGGWGDSTASWVASVGGTSVQPTSGTVQVNLDLADLSGLGRGGNEIFLHRQATADPVLNMMETDINMDTNSIVNILDIMSTGNTTIGDNPSDRHNITGDTNFDNNMRINEVLIVDGNAALNGENTIGDASSDNHRVNGDIVMANNATINGNGTIGDASSDNHRVNGGIVMANNATINGNGTIGDASSDNHRVNGDIVMANNATINGNGTVNGNTALNGNTRIGNSGTDSHTVQGTFVMQNNASVNGTLRVNGAVTFKEDLTLEKNVTAGNISASGLNINGNAVIQGNATVQQLRYGSDIRLKKDIKDIDGLEIIKKLSPKSYLWKRNDELSYGLIAQEVETHYPHLVGTDDNGLKSLDYVQLIAPLIQAVQSLEMELAELKSSINKNSEREF
jgi:competence protein ComGC